MGAALGLALAGNVGTTFGPFGVGVRVRPGTGDTVVALPPLGRLTARTHLAPLDLVVTLQDVGVESLTEGLRTEGVAGVAERVRMDALARALPIALRVLAVATAGALALSLLAFRVDRRRVLAAVLSGAVVTGASEVAAWSTYRPAALLAPTYSGSLALAPRLIGPAETALGRIDDFRAELERIVAGAARVYASVEASPLGGGDEIRLLHVSDIHLSPLGMDFARDVAAAFDVQAVIDTGDLTSFGTPAENLILSSISGFRRPYAFVRGNHDSPDLEAALRRIPNARVLDGHTTSLAGLQVYGLGHPVFSPDRQRAIDDESFAEAARASGSRIAADLVGRGRPPDVVAVHDDRMAEPVAGRVPLVVSGHFHRPSIRVVEGTVFLRVGTTGGAGADLLIQGGGIPLSAEVLYFQPGDPPALVAVDLIEQSPETGSLTVQRTLLASPEGPLLPPRSEEEEDLATPTP